MEQSVSKIIQTENQACALIEEIKNKKELLNNSVEKEVENLKEKYNARAQNRIEIVLRDENELLENALKDIEEQKQEKLSQMNKLSVENFDKWTEHLFKEITK